MYYLSAYPPRTLRIRLPLLIATNDHWHHIIVDKLLDEKYKLQMISEQDYYEQRILHAEIYYLDFKSKGFIIK